MASKSLKRLKAIHQTFAAKVNAAVGARIAERRTLAGLTLEDVGQSLGVTMQHAQRYEAGKSGLDVAQLISVARVLGCRTQDLTLDFDSGETSAPALSVEAAAIGKAADGIKSGGLRMIVKLVAEKLRAHERTVEKVGEK